MENTTGQRIRKARKDQRRPMKWLADKVGVTEQAISRYETGARPIQVEMLRKIAAALGVTEEYLLTGSRTYVTYSPVNEEVMKDARKRIGYIQLKVAAGVWNEASDKYLMRNEGSMADVNAAFDRMFEVANSFGFDDEAVMGAVQDCIRESKAAHNDHPTA